jgi:hypothetical protein
LEVFGAFGNNRVDHVVDRDDPKKTPLLVENWDGEQVIRGPTARIRAAGSLLSSSTPSRFDSIPGLSKVRDAA